MTVTKAKTFVLIAFTQLTSSLFAQVFIPNDVRIGNLAINYVNPEVSPVGNFMIWAEVDTTNGFLCKIWQCGIDPNTGDLIPPDGKGFNPFNSTIFSRPADWGLDSIGPYYVGATAFGQMKFVRPVTATSATVSNISVPINTKRRVCFIPLNYPGLTNAM